MGFFSPQRQKAGSSAVDFGYLPSDTTYLDTACQTLRPQAVLDAERDYYTTYNACGGRVKYPWGGRVDDAVRRAREDILRFTGKSARDYTVVFTLNTTYGINLVLQQLPARGFERIVTSDIEHNSVFLPTITWGKEEGVERRVLERANDGSLVYRKEDLDRSVVLLNSMSNIDGRQLRNVAQLAKDVHERDGVLLLDAAQHCGHGLDLLKDVHFDALFGSGHKMYGPSIGFIVIRKALIDRLERRWIGGGTVQDVQKDAFSYLDSEEEPYATLELGLQNWAGIIGLRAAVGWLEAWAKDGQGRSEYERELATILFSSMRQINGLTVVNEQTAPILSLYANAVDAHQLALYLGEQSIMCRSGYFCCHYYLKNKKKLPPLLRISLGLHNTADDISRLQQAITHILHTLS